MPPAWGHYPDTLLRFPDAGLTIDLRRPLDAALRRDLRQAGPGEPFAVITACNPLGGRHHPESNHRLDAVLSALVRERYPGVVRAIGSSPDGGHTEPGWAIHAPLGAARRLAEAFFQEALFWFDGERFYLTPVLAPYSTLALPVGFGVRASAE